MGSPWAAGRWRWFTTPDRRLLALSIALQLVLAALLGHAWDMRMFMATGYLVGTGHSPYAALDLAAVFHHVGFDTTFVIGYPPPWPLALGLIYRGAYAVGHDLIVYNLAIKLPVIVATVGLAYLVAAILDNLGAGREVARRAWTILLLNPFLLYVGAAWGQIDAVVAILALAALVLLCARRPVVSAVVLALAVCFKPIAAPVFLVVLVYLAGRSPRQALRYAAVFLAGVAAFYVAPFFVFGWDSAPLRHINAQLALSGTMSLMTVARLARSSLPLPGHWWLLGLAWIPALIVAVVALRRGVGELDDLIGKSAALVLVFYLTRTWLAEPNIVLLLPLVLILTSLGELDRRAFTAVWVIPLVFTLFNSTPLQLLFVEWPGFMERSLASVARYGDAMLIARALLVIAWQVVGWWIVVACFRRRPAGAAQPAGTPDVTSARAVTWN